MKIIKYSVLFLGFFVFYNFAFAQSNDGLENVVRASFSDMPEMITIAQCESGFRQFGLDGLPLRGGTGKKYIGIFQVAEDIHAAKAKNELAYDIYTIDGNIAYARYMYFASGSRPWKGCLNGASITPASTNVPVFAAPIANSTGKISINLNSGMTHQEVAVLQKILNSQNFNISPTGPGSSGNETSYFGSLTREAVKKFQCAKQIVCSGSESTTGFGRVGPTTRKYLNLI